MEAFRKIITALVTSLKYKSNKYTDFKLLSENTVITGQGLYFIP